VASIFVGMSLSILVACFVKTIRGSRFIQLGGPDYRKADAASSESRVQFFCICIASLFVVIWIGGQREEFSRIYQLFFRGYLEVPVLKSGGTIWKKAISLDEAKG